MVATATAGANKKARLKRAFPEISFAALLDLGFLVDHVLANRRVVLLRFQLFGVQFLVLVGRVVMTRPGAGYELDLVSIAFGHVLSSPA